MGDRSPSGLPYRRIVAVWAALIVLTMISWTEGGQATTLPVVALLLGITAIKATLVVYSFMEVAYAPSWLKALCAGWLGVVFAGIFLLVAIPEWTLSLR